MERDRIAVARMLRAEAHRGPDGEDCFADDTVVLGHRRLAIIDLSAKGSQPMANETRDVWISVNGEIYNYRALRRELEADGHEFASRTDVEVLLHGYEQWGLSGLLKRARGMFAFVLYDARRASETKLFLVRDRFGIKPLYYAVADDAIVFASELSALVDGGAVAGELDAGALTSFLSYGSIPGPGTGVKNVQTVPAGHYVEVSGGRWGVHRYWEMARDRDDGDEHDADISRLLREAVELHLVSDVPVGVFSSGGIDSATLVALASSAHERGAEPVTTLSVVFDDDELSEARYARLVAERYGTDHREISVSAREFFDVLPEVFGAMDSPTVDGVNTYFVSRAAKAVGVKVVLTGLGGDEVFFGYPHHKTLARLAPVARGFARLPRVVRRALARSAATISGRAKLDYLELPTATNLYRLFRGLFSPRQIAALVNGADPEPRADEPLVHQERDELLDIAARMELDRYLQHQLLRDTDAMSMAHSIEARVPFLDHELAEAVFRLPHATKFSSRMNKPILVNALDRPLPREVWDRPKQGFTLPFRRFMLEHQSELRARTQKTGLFSDEAAERIWSDFESGREHWSRPWALVAFTAWAERLRARASGPAEPIPVGETIGR